MWYLIKLEWLKMRRYSIFQVMAAGYLVLLPGVFSIGKTISLPNEISSSDVFYMFPTVWEFLGYLGNWMAFFFLGFISVISVTSEYTNRTLKQSVINGLSRRDLWLAKVFFILLISACATTYFTLVGLTYGFFNTDTIYMSKLTQNLIFVPRYFLLCVGYMSFGLFMGVLIRKTGVALFLYLIYIMFLEPLIRWAIHFRATKHISMHYYPMNAVEDLAPANFSFLDMAQQFLRENEFQFFLEPEVAAVLTVGYSGLFLYLAYVLLQRRDM